MSVSARASRHIPRIAVTVRPDALGVNAELVANCSGLAIAQRFSPMSCATNEGGRFWLDVIALNCGINDQRIRAAPPT